MDRFECQGCRQIVTADADVEDHKNRHGLIINIGPHDPEAAKLRRERASARDGARSVLTRLNHFGLEHHDILTMAELTTLGAAEETLRSIIKRMTP
jgi:hypothetical protein